MQYLSPISSLLLVQLFLQICTEYGSIAMQNFETIWQRITKLWGKESLYLEYEYIYYDMPQISMLYVPGNSIKNLTTWWKTLLLNLCFSPSNDMTDALIAYQAEKI